MISSNYNRYAADVRAGVCKPRGISLFRAPWPRLAVSLILCRSCEMCAQMANEMRPLSWMASRRTREDMVPVCGYVNCDAIYLRVK